MNNPLLGTWKLQSFTVEYQDTGQKIEPYGAYPSGYLTYGADCRMYVIVVSEGRKPPAGVSLPGFLFEITPPLGNLLQIIASPLGSLYTPPRSANHSHRSSLSHRRAHDAGPIEICQRPD
jgi:Lipocalin-like domain